MSARLLDCPQCGAAVTFRSSITVFAVCEHCRSMIVLRGAEAELIGVMAALPPDLSPFQIGTRGEWRGRGFEIVGRLRLEWEEGSWTEWCIVYDAIKTGWLAEAQGLFMISFPHEVSEKLPSDHSEYRVPRHFTFAQRHWHITDVKTTTYRAAEGELPFPIEPGQHRLSADLTDSKGGFATIELTEDGPEAFLGEYVEFGGLKLSNLRPVPGWSAELEKEANRTTALACLACGGVIELRAPGQSMSAACAHCGTLIDTATPELKIIETAEAAKKKLAPKLPIGQRGRLFDIEYEVIGFVRRADSYAKWDEYLLFNPWHGFRWLVTYNGHWSFITRLASMRDETGKSFLHQDRRYKLYAQATTTVEGVLGEFYWKVQRGEHSHVSDYIAPPYILSRETYPEQVEIAWSHGEYVEHKVIGEAFDVKDLRRPHGIYLNQPNRFWKRWKEVWLLFALAFIVLCLIQMTAVASFRETPITEGSFVYQRAPLSAGPAASPSEKMFTTPRFKLESGSQRVVIEAQAPVSNNWIGFDLDLVNAGTNTATSKALEVSAYSGYSSDGAWSEGGQQKSVSFPAVPPGEYFVTIEPTADATIQNMPFTIRVRAGGIFNSNFFFMLGLVSLYPAFLLWRSSSFEKRRWAESDFAP